MENRNCHHLLFILLIFLVPHLSNSCYIRVGLTDAQKNEILVKHNLLRNFTAAGYQPGIEQVSNMHELYWDESLATRAENWAKTCPSGHSPDRNGIGENLYFKMSPVDSGVDFSAAVQMWYDEVKDFSYFRDVRFGSSKTPDLGKIGHFTQVVWAETMRIGCSSSVFKRDNTFYTLLICDYDRGNIMGQELLGQGEEATGCWNTKRVSTTYTALCAAADAPNSRPKSCYFYHGISNDLKAKLLKKFNSLRDRVASGGQSGQPSASDMLEMEWDDDLANQAQNWVNTCPWNINPTPADVKMGQAYWTAIQSWPNDIPDLEKVIEDNWFSQVNEFNSSSVSSYALNDKALIYANIVYAKNNRLGCGGGVGPFGCRYRYMLGCNFGPGGMKVNKPLYTGGKPAALCKTKSLTFNNLCTKAKKASMLRLTKVNKQRTELNV